MLNVFSGATLFNNGGATLTWTAGTGTATVDNMSGMFFNADAFNSDISGWNVSAVTNMVNMFNSTALFNQDLSSWVVTQTTNCTGFSTGASSWVLNQPNFSACTP
jgi:surface protein